MLPRSFRRAGISLVEPLEDRIAPAAVSVPVASLNGTNGFKLHLAQDNARVGSGVSDIGDLNDDGIDDLLVGAAGAAGEFTSEGGAFVVFGTKAGFPANLDLATLDGTNGFVITATNGDDEAGLSVSAAGDVNGDGIADLVIGAPKTFKGPTHDRAATYVIFGKNAAVTPFAATLALNSLTGSNGFQILGAVAGDDAGSSVSAADVNGDGYSDILIGAPGGSFDDNDGAAYVVFGKNGSTTPFAATLSLAALDGTNGFKLAGSTADNEQTGYSVTGVDLNGDGRAEVVVGAFTHQENSDLNGLAYVYYGRASGYSASVSLPGLSGADGFKITPVGQQEQLGYSVSKAGDVNGDGRQDLLIGAPAGSFDDRNGRAYVLFGKSSSYGASFDLSTLDGTNGFVIHGAVKDDMAGRSVSNAGDVNGDGVDDVLIGAPFADNGSTMSAGAAYVIFGKKATPFSASISLATLDASTGFTITNAVGIDYLGEPVSTAGDLNHDGLADLVVGSPFSDTDGNNRGSAYVIFGFDPRITISKDHHTATLPDADGDLVTVKVTKGVLAPGLLKLGAAGGLDSLDLSAAGFEGTNVTISAAKVKNGVGDGEANVEFLDAHGVDLGTVSVDGLLERIDAGTGALDAKQKPIVAAKGLTVGALGAEAFQVGIPADYHSQIVGPLSALKVAGSVRDAFLDVSGATGTIGKITIGGDLDGTAGDADGGRILASAGIGAVTIKGSVLGGGDRSGIFSGGKLGKVAIAGDLQSSNAAKQVTLSAFGKSGASTAADALAIGGLSVKKGLLNAQIVAGFDLTSGAVSNATAGIGTVAITSSVINSTLRAAGAVGNVTIGNDLDGSAGGMRSGLIEGGTGVGAVTIKGSLIGGATYSGILSGGKLGKVAITGDLTSADATKPVLISALGKVGATKAADAVAIAGVAVKGNVLNARILAGYSTQLAATNPDAGIGAISVLGTWGGSSVAAGVKDTSTPGDLASPPDGFGQHDTPIGGDTLLATIASITIKGAALGSAAAGDFFGLTAQKIGKVSINGAVIVPTGSDTAITDDFHLVTFQQ